MTHKLFQSTWSVPAAVAGSGLFVTMLVGHAVVMGAHAFTPTLVWGIGGVLTVLLVVLSYLLQMTKQQTRAAIEAQHRLQAEIVEREHAVAVKEKLESMLQQNQKLQAMGTLASGIAHDFNNILYSMMGYASMAREDVKPKTQLHENLGKVLAAGEKGQELVSGMLSFSRQKRTNFAEIDLVQVIQNALQLVMPMMPAQAQLSQEIALVSAVISGRQNDLEQVLVNIINNAVAAVGEKGHVTIRLINHVPLLDSDLADLFDDISQYYCIIIEDDGCGMDTETQERIFDPFFTTKSVDQGTGLGLAIAHGIIKNHGGEIIVNSEAGKGTTFYIFLPTLKED